MLTPEHITALLKASGAKLIVAYGPSAELAIWGAVEKVLALHPLPVLRIDAQTHACAMRRSTGTIGRSARAKA